VTLVSSQVSLQLGQALHVETGDTERCSRKAERYAIYPHQSLFYTSSIPHFPRCHGVLALVRLFRNPKTFRRRLKAPFVGLKHRTLAVCASALEDSDRLIWVPRLRHGSSLSDCAGFLGEEEGGVQTHDPSFSRLRIHIRADQTPVSLVSPARTSEAWP